MRINVCFIGLRILKKKMLEMSFLNTNFRTFQLSSAPNTHPFRNSTTFSTFFFLNNNSQVTIGMIIDNMYPDVFNNNIDSFETIYYLLGGHAKDKTPMLLQIPVPTTKKHLLQKDSSNSVIYHSP